jgi:hypothetical protein
MTSRYNYHPRNRNNRDNSDNSDYRDRDRDNNNNNTKKDPWDEIYGDTKKESREADLATQRYLNNAHKSFKELSPFALRFNKFREASNNFSNALFKYLYVNTYYLGFPSDIEGPFKTLKAYVRCSDMTIYETYKGFSINFNKHLKFIKDNLRNKPKGIEPAIYNKHTDEHHHYLPFFITHKLMYFDIYITLDSINDDSKKIIDGIKNENQSFVILEFIINQLMRY